jgi:hypothetical protein
MPVKKMKVVTVETPGTLKESILTLTGEYDISKASFIYEAGNAKIVLYGKTGNEGIAGQENKYEFPPPFDKELFFGKCFLVKYSAKDLKPLCLTVNEWKEIYNKLYGGFEELTEVDEEDAREIEEEKQLLNTPTIEFTKEGYVKDGMIVDDDDDEDENYEPIKQKKSTKKRKSKEDIPEPVKIKKPTKKPSVATSIESFPVDVTTPPLVPPPPSPSSLLTEPLEQESTPVNPVKPEKKKTSKAKKTSIESLPNEVVLIDNSTTVENPTITEKKKTSKSKKAKIEAPDANGIVEPDLLNDNNNNTKIKKPPRVKKPKVEMPPLPLPTMAETLNDPPAEVPPPKKSRTKKPAVKQPPTEEIVQSTDELPTPPPANTKKPKASKESKPKKTTSKTKKTEDTIAESQLTCENELIEEQYIE